MISDLPLPLAQAASQNTLTIQIIALILALVLCALASAAETALTSVNRIRIKNLAEDGDVRSQQIEQLLLRPGVFLTTILVMNNVAIILATTLATSIALSFTPQWGEVIATILMSFVTLVFCEITPKNAAVQNAESWARALVPLVRAAAWLFQPINAFLNGITRAILRLLGIPLRRTGPSVTEEELMLLVNVGEEEGILEKDERSMIHSIFGLADTTVREIMVPRIDMVTLEADTSVPEAVAIITQGGKSRIPVFDDTIDNILGVLYAKDLLRELSGKQTQHTVRALVRPAYFVPESKKLDDLLHELQNQRVHMAIVIDEYGAVAGLVTIEDLVEEIIGDIQDEYDREEQLFEQISSTEYIVDAKMNIDDFNEMIGVELEAGDEYDTVGGFVLSQLDKIPNVGDAVTTPEVKLTVLSTRGRRITKIKAVLTHPGEYTAPPTNDHRPSQGSDEPSTDDRPNNVELSAMEVEANGAEPALPPAELPAELPSNNQKGGDAPGSSEPDTPDPTRQSVPARLSAHQPRRRSRRR